MKKLIFIIIVLLFPITINADVCSTALSDAKKVTAEYEFMYDEEGFPSFKVTLKNMTNNIVAEEETGETVENFEFITDAWLDQHILEVSIFDKDFKCSTPLRILKVTLPQYNQYSNMKVCENIKNYKYCQTVITEKIDTSEIYENIKKYKQNLMDSGKIEKTNIEEEFEYVDNIELYNLDEFSNNKNKEEKTETNKNGVKEIFLILLIAIPIVTFALYEKKK